MVVVGMCVGSRVSLYKILFHFKALLGDSIVFLPPPPHLRSLPYCNTTARPLRNIYPPPTPPLYAVNPTILVMAISCKGQVEGAWDEPLTADYLRQ